MKKLIFVFWIISILLSAAPLVSHAQAVANQETTKTVADKPTEDMTRGS